MIDQITIQAIQEASKIEEVVGEYVQLRKRGANLLGLCPFHNEKSPSFTVSPAKGIYKCFGCGKAGNSVQFLMEHEHFSYPEALRHLARKYGIEIEEKEQSAEQLQEQSEREALFHVTTYAQRYFSETLFESEKGKIIGLSYLKERGLSEGIIKKFGLGYGLDEWDDFTRKALKEGYTLDILEKAGLTIKKEDKSYDRFRGRVLFPVYSISGRVLGFSGRILSSEKQGAKYVNSPESDIYIKSKTLYGLFQAKNEISKQDMCYLVEGNIDVLSLFQSGIENTVASSGTSLTAEQIKLIKRFTQNVTILYDGDSAGIKAALRATDMLIEEGLQVRIVLFPTGMDPDTYAQTHTREELQEFITTHSDNFILFKTKLLSEEAAADPIKRAHVIHELVQTIALIPDRINRSLYIRECASIVKVQEQILATEVDKCLRQKISKDVKNISAQNSPLPLPEINPHNTLPQESGNLLEYQEQKIISILLHHGTKETIQEQIDEKGNKTKETYYVAAFIIGDIVNDELDFENPSFQTIFNTYKDRIMEGSILSEQFFIQHPDEVIRNKAISLLSDTYSISSLWKSRWQIYVPTPEEQHVIDADIRNTLLVFKLKKLEKKISNLENEMKTAQEEEALVLMHKKKLMMDIKRVICKELKRVI